MRVLVCGGRDFEDVRLAMHTLDSWHAAQPISCIIEGGAEGADRLARRWAYAAGIGVDTYKADWDLHGRAAGPIRNQRMIDEGKPDLVIAFPGGRGTADMVRRARVAAIDLLEASPFNEADIQEERAQGSSSISRVCHSARSVL